MKKIMYVFDEIGRLSAIQDVTGWPDEMVTQARRAVHMDGRTAEISDQGRTICCLCRDDLGPCDIPAGKLSHGYCEKHFAAEMAEIESEENKYCRTWDNGSTLTINADELPFKSFD